MNMPSSGGNIFLEALGYGQNIRGANYTQDQSRLRGAHLRNALRYCPIQRGLKTDQRYRIALFLSSLSSFFSLCHRKCHGRMCQKFSCICNSRGGS
jgi:hypothetical protein